MVALVAPNEAPLGVIECCLPVLALLAGDVGAPLRVHLEAFASTQCSSASGRMWMIQSMHSSLRGNTYVDEVVDRIPWTRMDQRAMRRSQRQRGEGRADAEHHVALQAVVVRRGENSVTPDTSRTRQ
jgi:hypothetical protein